MATATYTRGRDDLQKARVASAGNVLAGLWLIAAPFVLNFEGSNVAQWNHIAVGAAVVLIALVRASDPDHREGMSWVSVVLGVWMIAAPFVLAYSGITEALTNSIVTGVIIIALGAFSAYETNHAHHEVARDTRTRNIT